MKLENRLSLGLWITKRTESATDTELSTWVRIRFIGPEIFPELGETLSMRIMMCSFLEFALIHLDFTLNGHLCPTSFCNNNPMIMNAQSYCHVRRRRSGMRHSIIGPRWYLMLHLNSILLPLLCSLNFACLCVIVVDVKYGGDIPCSKPTPLSRSRMATTLCFWLARYKNRLSCQQMSQILKTLSGLCNNMLPAMLRSNPFDQTGQDKCFVNSLSRSPMPVMARQMFNSPLGTLITTMCGIALTYEHGRLMDRLSNGRRNSDGCGMILWMPCNLFASMWSNLILPKSARRSLLDTSF